MDEASGYHYIVIFMVADVAPGASATNLEPDKCGGWYWHRWSEALPSPTFRTLADVRALGFNPFADADAGLLAQDADGQLPPYCCCILHEGGSGAVLLEQRGDDAKVAAGQRTCFGGKRELSESPLACVHRELREELGFELSPSSGLRRAVDLYVDGKLIAWFFEAAAPAREAPLTYEEGRSGVWLPPDEDMVSVSPWHAAVLAAWRRGERRVDFETPV